MVVGLRRPSGKDDDYGLDELEAEVSLLVNQKTNQPEDRYELSQDERAAGVRHAHPGRLRRVQKELERELSPPVISAAVRRH